MFVVEMFEICSTTLCNSYQRAPFKCKTAVLLYVFDYPGIRKVMSVVGSGGFQGCKFCDIEGSRNEDLKKMIYVQNRRFLNSDSVLQKDKEWYVAYICVYSKYIIVLLCICLFIPLCICLSVYVAFQVTRKS